MTTIANFVKFQEADMARARLEAAGIRTFIPQEAESGAVGVDALIIGYRLQVPEEDAERALEILRLPLMADNDSGSPEC
jgi:hypothetical protein